MYSTVSAFGLEMAICRTNLNDKIDDKESSFYRDKREFKNHNGIDLISVYSLSLWISELKMCFLYVKNL